MHMLQRKLLVVGLFANTAWLERLLTCALFICGSWSAHATVSAVSVQSPGLSSGATTSVTTPVHFAATAESDLNITGYVVYVDGNNVFRNFSPSLDAWAVLPRRGTYSVFITAWDSSGSHLSPNVLSPYIHHEKQIPSWLAFIANFILLVGIEALAIVSWAKVLTSALFDNCYDGYRGTKTSATIVVYYLSIYAAASLIIMNLNHLRFPEGPVETIRYCVLLILLLAYCLLTVYDGDNQGLFMLPRYAVIVCSVAFLCYYPWLLANKWGW
jgi:hypothetical protein